MSQDAGVQITLTAIGINELTVRILCYRIDSEIPSGEVLFQRDAWVEPAFKAMMTRPTLAFGPSEGVLLFCLRVQKYREILADLGVPKCTHLIRRSADHHPVSFCDRDAEQRIAHGTAD